MAVAILKWKSDVWNSWCVFLVCLQLTLTFFFIGFNCGWQQWNRKQLKKPILPKRSFEVCYANKYGSSSTPICLFTCTSGRSGLESWRLERSCATDPIWKKLPSPAITLPMSSPLIAPILLQMRTSGSLWEMAITMSPLWISEWGGGKY